MGLLIAAALDELNQQGKPASQQTDSVEEEDDVDVDDAGGGDDGEDEDYSEKRPAKKGRTVSV